LHKSNGKSGSDMNDDTYQKQLAYARKYQKTAKGRQALKRYDTSEKGRIAHKRYRESEGSAGTRERYRAKEDVIERQREYNRQYFQRNKAQITQRRKARMNEAVITSQIYDILSMSEEPMSATEIGRELRPEMSATEVNRLLNKIITEYSGIGRGYTPGTFVKVGNRWTIKQFGITPSKTTIKPELFITAII